jgi:tetratricopeptide (TPR) repeat protein/predicted Ser/Thr protein kinase
MTPDPCYNRPVPDTPPEAAEAPELPRKLGKYALREKLGQGGMGVVYKAWDEHLGRWVALKFLTGGDREDQRRFLREAQTSARVQHPNIVPVYEVGELDGRLFIAMQYVPGTTLDRARLPVRRLLEAVRDVGLAIHQAHKQGIIHRDLKPGNIMVTPERQTFVMDFGLAKPERADSSISASGVVLGTPHYMSPEQATGHVRAVDHRADIYSLGATLYHLLAGRPPHVGETSMAVLMSALNEDPTPLRKLAPEVPRDVETIVHKAMERDRDRRYASAAAFSKDLDRFLNDEPIAARPASVAYRLSKRIRRNPTASTALLVAVIALAVGGAFAVRATWGRRTEELGRAAARERRARASVPFQKGQAAHREAENLYRYGGTLAELRAARGRARQFFREAAAEDPSWEEAHLHLGKTAAEEGDLAAAERHLTRAIELAPSSPAAYLSRGKARLRSEATKPAARADFQKARALSRDPREQRAAEAATAWCDGRFDEAAELLSRAIEADRFDGDAYFLRALAFQKVGRPDRTVEDLTQVLKIHALNVEALLLRSQAYRVQGRVPSALADAQSALDLDPGSRDALLARAAAHEAAGDFEKVLADAAALKSAGTEVSLLRARALEGLQRHEEALAELDRAPSEPGVPRAKARILHVLGRVEEALAAYAEALAADPRDAASWEGQGSLKSRQGRHDEAVADLTRAIELDPKRAGAWRARALARRARGDGAGADADEAEARRLREEDVAAIVEQARRLEKKGDLAAAVSEWDRALRLRPNDFELLNARGDALFDLRDFKRALADYERMIQLRPEAPEGYYHRGNCKFELGEDPMADFDKAIDLDPRFYAAYTNRGRLHCTRGDLPKGIADFTRAIQLNPREHVAFQNRGTAKSQNGDLEGALPDYSRAIELNPRYARAYANRGQCYYELKQYARAKADLEKAVELDPALRDSLQRVLEETRRRTPP